MGSEFNTVHNCLGQAVVQLVEALRYGPDGRGFDSGWGSLEFLIDLILSAALWPWGGDSASNRNEYQEYFLGVKAAGA
jgi:hypothetical protein